MIKVEYKLNNVKKFVVLDIESCSLDSLARLLNCFKKDIISVEFLEGDYEQN